MRFIATILAALCLVGTAKADDTIMIVFDTSGSMGDYMRSAGKTRMEVAQDALIEVLSKTPDTTKIGILGFGGWIKPIGPVDRAKLEDTIRSIRPGGGTPLYEYMRAAGTALLQERQKQLNVGSYKLLVITDGAAGDDNLNDDGSLNGTIGTWEDGTPRLGVLADIMSRNITVDTIALDMKADHPLKNSINGSYMRGDDPSSLVEAMSKAVAEVGFGDSKDASEDAFAEIADLPVDSAIVILKGLSTFPNHKIGEKPPIPVVQEDGTVTLQPDPANESVPELGEANAGGGIGGIGWILGVIGVIVCAIVLLIAFKVVTEGC